MIRPLCKSIKRFSRTEYQHYVTSLYQKPEGHSDVSGIKISFGEKVTQVRVTRDKREVTKAEVETLAKEHSKEPAEIAELLTKRKVKICDNI